jgi:hypothetical protein
MPCTPSVMHESNIRSLARAVLSDGRIEAIYSIGHLRSRFEKVSDSKPTESRSRFEIQQDCKNKLIYI